MPALLPDDVASLALFAQVVQTQSFTAAAKRLGLSKSAVSARVAGLESRLGVRLLQRTTRRLSLTEVGLEVYGRAARVLSESEAAAAAAIDLGKEVRGTLRVNAAVTFSRLHLAPLLPAFLEKHPELSLDLTTENRFVDVIHDGYDVVLRIAPDERMRDAEVTARRLAEDANVVVASPAYLEARGRPRTPDELASHRCLRYALNAPQESWRFFREGRWQGIAVKGPLGSNDADALIAAAVAGAGMLIIPSFMIAEPLAQGRLQRVLAAYRFPEVRIYALFPSRKHVPAKVRAFVDFLAASLSAGLSGAATAKRTPR